MVNNKIYSFRKMNKDIAEGKYPEGMYFDAKNLRFLTNEEVISGGFSFEKGNLNIVNIPSPVINSSLKRIEYSVGTELKYVNYFAEGIQPRNEIESTYFISNGVYKTSGVQKLIGFSVNKDNIIILSSDNNGFDCIWKIDDFTNEISLLYVRDLKFSNLNPIQALNNFENEKIDKIYWVDSKNQMRFINIFHSIENGDLEELIDLDSNAIQMVGTFDFDQPEIIDIVPGGKHTSGMIQYAYNLFRINGSQTKISPLSELIPLDKGLTFGGGEVNEVVGSTPVVQIDNIDNSYTNLRLYAIKYTSYNQSPSVNLIAERDISAISTFTYYDDGGTIEPLSVEEFLFLGSDLIIPRHINSKDNRMFLADYKEKTFDIDQTDPYNIDFRAFAFKSDQTCIVYNGVFEDSFQVIQGTEPVIITNSFSVLPDDRHASINKDFDTYKYQSDGTTIGGEGKFLKYELTRNQIGFNGFTAEDSKGKFLKDNEIYRISLQLYNKYGQNSLPKWIADFKTIVAGDNSNLNFFYSGLKIELKPEFYIWLNDDNNFLDGNGDFDDSLKPVGYRLLRADRTILDRSILCQGILNGMISVSSGSNAGEDGVLITRSEIGLKIPSLMRRFDSYIGPMRGMENGMKASPWEVAHPNMSGPEIKSNREFQSNNAGSLYSTFVQNNKLMQMFSPEITFNEVNEVNTNSLKVIGRARNDENKAWLRAYNMNNGGDDASFKINNAIDKYDTKAVLIDGAFSSDVQLMGLISQPNDTNLMHYAQYYRAYNGGVESVENYYEIYKKALVIEKGQERTLYNNESSLSFANSFEPIATDGGDLGDEAERIGLVNSWGARNSTFALKGSGRAPEIPSAIGDLYYLEDLFEDAGGVLYNGIGNNGDDYHGIIAEFTIPRNIIYLGNLYGGNSYESKRRSNYVEFGRYNDISVSSYECLTPGDTFVDKFSFTKTVKTDTDKRGYDIMQITEIVSVTLESTVDLKNRNDYSIQSWSSRNHPRYDEFQKYNRVYSQNSNLIIRRDLGYKFKRINNFDTNVITTKLKTPGEVTDSWTDLQQNNVLTLDGKYGSINSLISYKDEIYTFQDKAIAKLSINPRVQTQGSDGLSIQLGTGNVLDRYDYITTNSGSINKWGVLSTETGVYYYDALNKSFNMIGQQLEGLSDKEGLHKFFLDITNRSTIIVDNPLIGKGVSIGWDKITNDVYLSILDDENKTTISYNLFQEGFSSQYDYHSSAYIFAKGRMITVNPDAQNELYENFLGDYNVFYGQNKKSSLSFFVNPEPHVECTFNNLEYKSETWNSLNQEIGNYTWERIKAENEFQNSGLIDLNERFNIRKLNRKWRLNIPRDLNKVNRIRNTWSLITLESNNIDKYRYRNNDIILYYISNYKRIQ